MPDPLWINCPTPGAAPQYTAAELRQAMALGGAYGGRNLGARQGVRPGGTQWQVTLAGTTITIAAGVGLVDPGLTTSQGPYWVALPADETQTLQAAHATSPRKDIVVIRVYDNDEDASGLRLARSEYLPGVAAPSPSEPAVPAGATRIATIDVPASGGGSPVVTQNAPFTVAPGGLLPVRNATEQAAVVAAPGLVLVRLDTLELLLWDGAAFSPLKTLIQAATVAMQGKHFLSGRATVNFTSGQNHVITTIPFGYTFPASPQVVCNPVVHVGTIGWHIENLPTTTSFQIAVFITAGGNFASTGTWQFDWLAIG